MDFLSLLMQKEGLSPQEVMQQMQSGELDKMMKYFAQRMKGGVEADLRHAEMLALRQHGGRSAFFMDVLDRCISEFIIAQGDLPSTQRFPAVDLATGTALYPFIFAQRYRKLDFVPTDWQLDDDAKSGFKLTLNSLKFMASRLRSAENVLFTDSEGKAVIVGGNVELKGLQKTEFNGLHGAIAGPPEPDSKGCLRYPVKLDEGEFEENGIDLGPNTTKHFKPDNLLRSYHGHLWPTVVAGIFRAQDSFRKTGSASISTDAKLENSESGAICDVRICSDIGTKQYFDEVAVATRADKAKKRKAMSKKDAAMLGDVQDMTYGFAALDSWPDDPQEHLNGLSIRQDKARIAESLLENARPVNIQDPSTWKKVLGNEKDITGAQRSWNHAGKCCLVTCICLLVQKGHEQPVMWQDVMRLASQLLAPGGCLLMYDTEKWGKFANIPAMEKFVASEDLLLEFVEKNEPIDYGDDRDGRMFIVLFRKKREAGS
eukprot:TRINITY_DN19551_c0_g1_i1.p1 TRINITY_DN19551_c0_g1~~TRINITY_DN19551_c0_g1_i1.p1  ORF type:complete len:486 (-),score=69.06 TRINITY_DN19551_c0_g1_i1:93-1550(-)